MVITDSHPAKESLSQYEQTIEQNSDFDIPLTVLSRRGLERLDLLLIAVESLELNSQQAMVWTSKQIGLEKQFPNLVELWKLRAHNPLRKASRRGLISSSQCISMIRLLSAMSQRVYPIVRQFISSKDSEKQTQERLNLFTDRIRELLQERMNLRRGAVQNLLNSKELSSVSKELLFVIALSGGPGGFERLREYLMQIS